jgi:AcrR family transcriptional regulator
MPRVAQQHLDARRQQIVDAARTRFTRDGFARTSMADIVTESGLSTGAIYRYFKSKGEIVAAVCEQEGEPVPGSLDVEAWREFLAARDSGHAALVVQIYAEAALSDDLTEIVQVQQANARRAVADLVNSARRNGELPPGRPAEDVAEAFIAVLTGFSLQLALRGEVDPAPFAAALGAIVGKQTDGPERG